MKRFFNRDAVLIVLVCMVLSCSGRDETPKVRSGFLLGTLCSISLYDGRSDSTLDQAFEILREIDSKMGMNQPSSEIYRINAASGAFPVEISADTTTVIKSGLAFTQISRGRFDITVGPLVSLWGIGTEEARIPDQREIDEALGLIGIEHVLFHETRREVFLKKPGMKLDLGGIAKGYAADVVADYLKAQGVTRAIIDFGGNIFVLGSKGPDKPWRIGIQHPEKNRGAYLGVVPLSNQAAVTSGKYERFMDVDGKRYHHILDTRTGYPVENRLSSVTIIANDSMTADAMSTGVFAAGLVNGLKIVEETRGIDAILVTKDRMVVLSSGLDGLFTITDPDYRLTKMP